MKTTLGLLGALAMLCATGGYEPAYAQTAQPVTACGSITYTANGEPRPFTQTTDGKLCTNANSSGSVNATIVGPLGTQTLANSPAVTSADCNLVTVGCVADSAWVSGNGTLVSLLKAQIAAINLPIPACSASPCATTIGDVGGAETQGAAVAGGMFRNGCRGATTTPTAVTDTQAVDPQCTVGGKQVVVVGAIPENHTQGVTAAMTGTTSTLLLAAPAAGLRNYVTHISCGNSHATVGTFITVQDGSGGTALGNLTAASVFGGESDTDAAVLYRQPTTATGLYVADVTTGANVICEASGYVAP